MLRILLDEEVTGPQRRDPADAAQESGVPAGKAFSTWRPEGSSITEATQNALATLEWVGRQKNLASTGLTREVDPDHDMDLRQMLLNPPVVSPFADNEMIDSSKPSTERACFDTVHGSNSLLRSRGISIRTDPTSVCTVSCHRPLR